MKRLLIIFSLLFVCIDSFAQFHIEDGVVYCDREYLIIGRIQANFFDDMAVCQYPSGYAFMLLEGDRVLASVNLGETKEQAIAGIQEFIDRSMEKVTVRKEYNLKNIQGKDVIMIVYPGEKNGLKTNVRLYCPSENMGSGIILLNNLNYFNKILAKYPGVQFKQ